MQLSTIDWTIVLAFFCLSLGIGLFVARRSGKNSAEYFLSGRNMPWFLLGISMVATTFSADTPNLVTDIVRKNGVSGNWVWWAFLLTGMLTVFVYAKLWRRSGILTDLEFYEMRYSGKAASFLRGFRAIYLGVFFNVVIMATVCLAAIKIGSVLLGLTPIQTILIASIITVIYASFGGLRGVIYTDFFQFIMAMAGAIWAVFIILDLPEINGINNLLNHPNLSGKLDLLPDLDDSGNFYMFLILPLAVQWWSVWYPGAEPGGGGYVAQRMLAAKDEKNAIAATLLFNIAHYALRPWPWIIIALASLVMFPDLNSLREAFPGVESSVVNDDLAYSAMLTFLPKGLLGLVVASLIAAFMSTISTHLNWGASYIVNDWYLRFVHPEATSKRQILIGRLSTWILMALAAGLALLFSNALEAFGILLQIGAGTGLLFILRWFWWRINAYGEIVAMVVSFLMAIYLEILHVRLGFEPLPSHVKLLTGVFVTTLAWVITLYITPQTSYEKLLSFYKKIKPASAGWKRVINRALQNNQLSTNEVVSGRLPMEISAMVAGCFFIYSALFGTGYIIYSMYVKALVAILIFVFSAIYLLRVRKFLVKSI